MFIRLRAARPEDWTGKLSDFLVGLVFLSASVAVLLARLPDAWVAAVDGRSWIIRVGLVLVLLWLNQWVGNIIRTVLPRAPYLFGRTLTVRERGRRVRLPVREIARVYVEPRPPGERDTFVVALKNGETYDLCPIAWQGAARLYARLVRALPRPAA
ncbi:MULTISPECIES: hypothetical protein [Nannocystis]|uniref:PH domain-containing protein n=1 Tax=Nannocystis radixulma TaxID=2995305 RepID=A0ABT5BDC6_9BACT|nr:MULTISPECIES: hypothetical protein [Nannocystis]MCY1058722.1 hypothetical protein [Nannocystis sp. SCPEA4]MDC0671519.1 hypothetical protein [Nannocystis radixulma]